MTWLRCIPLMFKVSCSLFRTLFILKTRSKNLALCFSDWLFHTERMFVCTHLCPLNPRSCCKLIPYVYCARGLWVTSKYERPVVRELLGAHLNSPSVLVQQEMMFQSVEWRFFLKGPIDNQWGGVRWKKDSPLQMITTKWNKRHK